MVPKLSSRSTVRISRSLSSHLLVFEKLSTFSEGFSLSSLALHFLLTQKLSLKSAVINYLCVPWTSCVLAITGASLATMWAMWVCTHNFSSLNLQFPHEEIELWIRTTSMLYSKPWDFLETREYWVRVPLPSGLEARPEIKSLTPGAVFLFCCNWHLIPVGEWIFIESQQVLVTLICFLVIFAHCWNQTLLAIYQSQLSERG